MAGYGKTRLRRGPAGVEAGNGWAVDGGFDDSLADDLDDVFGIDDPAGMPAQPRPLSVAELIGSVNSTLERGWGSVRVEGEIHSIKVYSSGHIYFDLKDGREEALISCVMFRGNTWKLKFSPRRGDKVEVLGGLNIYPARGQMQLVVRDMVAAGAGALYARFLALKERLEAEGLFDPAKKRPLPNYPDTIGIVTSHDGAAIRDALKVIRQTAPWVAIRLYHTPVQGAEAENEIRAALIQAGVERAADVVIVIRGGGSIADLWSFNSERIARVVRRMPMPVVTGVGHESDFTIIDFAADVRAPTPTAAAAAALGLWPEVPQKLQRFEATLAGHLQRTLRMARLRLGQADRLKPTLEMKLAHERMRLAAVGDVGTALERLVEKLTNRTDQACDRMEAAVHGNLQEGRWQLAELTARLRRVDFSAAQMRLNWADRLGDVFWRRWTELEDRTRGLESGLRAAMERSLQDRRMQTAGLAARLQRVDFSAAQMRLAWADRLGEVFGRRWAELDERTRGFQVRLRAALDRRLQEDRLKTAGLAARLQRVDFASAQVRLAQAGRLDDVFGRRLAELADRTRNLEGRLRAALDRRLQAARLQTTQVASRIQRVDFTGFELRLYATRRIDGLLGQLVADGEKRIAQVEGRLAPALKHTASEAGFRLLAAEARLAEPRLAESRQRLDHLRGRLVHIYAGRVMLEGERVKSLAKRLSAMDVAKVLKRGYAIALDAEGRPVRDAADLARGDALEVRLARGSVMSRVENLRTEDAPAAGDESLPPA